MMRSTHVRRWNLAAQRLRHAGRVPLWFAGVIAVLLLISSGVVYRLEATHLGDLPPVTLPRPLSDIPLKIGDLVGHDVELPRNIEDYMRTHFADDFIYRSYSCAEESFEAILYVVYCSSRPAGILGHKPQVCYRGNGWIPDETVESQAVLESGRQIPCLVHRFHKPIPDYRNTVVLSFYILSGCVTVDEREISRIRWRRNTDPARYVAQIQISSALEQPARTVLAQVGDAIFAFLPEEENGALAGEPFAQERRLD